MYQDVDACDADIAKWKQTAIGRRDLESRFGDAIVRRAQDYGVTINDDKP
jgi:hypothetical protein